MEPVSLPFADRARKNEKVILSELAETGQAVAASCMGVNESTVSRLKQGDIEQASKLLAACGLKVVPVSFRCYPEEEIAALRVLARRSDVLRADNLSWSIAALRVLARRSDVLRADNLSWSD